MSTEKKPAIAVPPTKRQLVFFSWTKVVLIYIIVLNLFVEYNSKIIIDSFTISIFTAVLLKILLEIILKLEHQVAAFFEGRKVLQIFFAWIILFGSKFVILEIVDIVFGEHVELGKFVDVIVLVIALMVAREIFQQIYLALGERQEANK
jgi:FlaA1/EpsC-like NDP-sugar epimerase